MIAVALTVALLGMQVRVAAAAAQQSPSAPKAKVTNPHGPISIPCQNCHTYVSWKPIRSNPEFNHDQTGYPLRGMHAKVPCTQCHTSLVFRNVSKRCADCHADIHRRQFGANCEQCHSVRGWQVSVKDVQNHQNRFPLIGAHALVQCDECHRNAAAGQFTGLSTSCYSCHQKDFLTPVVNHRQLNFPTTCESCHSMNSWIGAKFDHLKYTGYALTGAHATLACTDCHSNNVFAGTSAQCYSCHTKDYVNSTNPPHVQLGLPRDCGTCHSTSNWANAQFDHALFAHWPLTGKHAAVTCAQCHTNNNYVSTPTDCYSCHKADFGSATNPNHVSSGFPTDCSLCHTTAGWTPSSFNHATVFPLTGAHATVACAQCHTNNNYTSLPKDCYTCHVKDFTGSTNPSHVQLNLPHTCDTCHTTTDWNNAKFDHTLYANYPLTGAHATLQCTQCHKNNNYTNMSVACVSCHQADFNGATNPNHVKSGFPTDCSVCHNTTAWQPSTFNHNNTKFPLTGAHVNTSCAQCHVNNNYTSLPTDCYSCHKTDYNGTTNPNHISVGFPTTCVLCHSTVNWSGATFNHNNTPFPLTGAHATVACAQCHVNNNYTTVPTACYGCHQKDFTGTTNPAHASAGFPTDCTLCHTTSAWQPSSFNHASVFPLTGAHANVACAQCHVNNNYTSVPTDCYSCHKADYNGTKNPNHASAGFPTTCATCHSTTDWSGASFNHNTTTFPLTGAHVNVTCAQCHVNNNYTTLPTNCYGCHQADFTGAASPAHVASGFPTDCTLCHTTSAWQPSSFNHASVFALTGAHATVPCASCHKNNNYTTVPTNCYGCHQSDFTGANNPSHVAAGFPTTCDTCHNTSAWTTLTSFNHTLYANYALTGAHATLQCAQCHVGNNYSTTSTACYSCHQSDFTSTNNPNHVTAGFPTDCSICHSTTNWTSSTFNHNATSFPLTGAHISVQCVQCHTSASTYNGSLPTACYGCHQKDWNGTTDPNHAAAGFPTTCDTCHTTTNWSGATFNHNNTPFPLTGAHTSVACSKCHVNNVFAGTPTDCYSCHTADYNGTTNPNHKTAGWPTTCTTCHTTAGWLPANLPTSYHTFFQIPHGNTSTCTVCHLVSSDYAQYSCTATCHGSGNAANFSHPNVSNYVYSPTSCYQCHKSGGGG